MDFREIEKMQGARKLIRQWNTLKSMDTPAQRVVFQVSGPGGGSNFTVMQSDPEFDQIWALVKAMVDRKYEEQAEVLIAKDIETPDILPTVKEKVKQRLGK